MNGNQLAIQAYIARTHREKGSFKNGAEKARKSSGKVISHWLNKNALKHP